MADFDPNALFDGLPTEAEQKEWEKANALFDDLPLEGQQLKGSFLKEVPKELAAGVGGATAITMKGIASQQEAAKEDRANWMRQTQEQFNQIDKGTFQEGKISDPDILDRVELYKQSTPEQRSALREAFKVTAEEQPSRLPQETGLFKAGQALQERVSAATMPAKDYENSLTRQFFEGLAQTGTLAAATVAHPLAGFEAGVSMTAGDAVDQAIKNGASKEDILKVANLSFLPGATEIAPMELLLDKIPITKWGRTINALVKLGATAAAEGGQEMVQQVMGNVIAKFTYKPDQDIFEGVWQAGGLGAAIGAVFGTVGAVHDFRTYKPGTRPPPPGQEAPPPGAEDAGAVLPEEGAAEPAPPGYIQPEDLPAGTMVVDDPGGPLHGMEVAVLKSEAQMSTVRDADGKTHLISNTMLKSVGDLAKGGIKQALQPPPPDPDKDRPDSPRLTPADRASPIPNEIIDSGKRAVEAATGQESKITTADVVDGHVQVTDTNVSDIVAKDRAETAALVDRITAGVAPAEIAPESPQPAPPDRAEAVPGVETPAETIAAPPASPAEAPLSPAVAEHHAAATAPSPDQLPSIPGTPMAKQGDTLADQIKKLKARAAAYDAQVEELAASGTSIRMVSNRDPTKKVLIGPDMSAQDKGKFRVTYIDQHGPSGHTVHNTMEDAARQVIGSYHPIGQIDQQVVRQDVAYTPGGREVPVTYAIVSADDLVTSQRDEGGANPAYPQELQPRDRSRGTSDQQINSIAQNLNPALLDNNASATDGAPIVSADGVVESGNGRVLGIRRAYNQNLPGAQAYRDYLDSQGYFDVTASEGIKNPVLVRIRRGALEPDARAAFAREANERTTLAMSATEKAMADAAAMSPETVGLFRGGEVADAGNREFVRSFMQGVVNPNEQAAMVTPDGGLSQEAIRRVQGALLARAYGDADLVGTLLESPDTNIKAIGGALMDVAGPWAQMRTEAKAGDINPEVDITPAVLEAVRLVERARSEGRPLTEFVNQKDIFSGRTISPEAEAVLRLMFRNTASWTMPAGRAKIAEALTFFATEARKTSAGVDLLGETAPPASKILETAKARQYGPEETQAKLPSGDRTAGKDTGAPSKGRGVEAKPGAQAEGRPSPAAKAPAPKFSLGERVQKPEVKPGKVTVVGSKIKAAVERLKAERKAKQAAEEEATLAALKERMNTPEIRAGIARMDAIPLTDLEDGTGPYKEFGPYNSDQWWASRIYHFGNDRVRGFANAIPLLIDRARNLAVKELNEDRKKAGKPLLDSYTPDRKRRATIIIGEPGAGKSGIANPVALKNRAAIVDVDDAKQVIPEYQDGIGANAVHEESSVMGREVLAELASNGDNLVIPKIGHTLDSIEALREDLTKFGYKVELMLMRVTPETALTRMLKRFKSKGRLINPTYFLKVVGKPVKTYVQAKQIGKFDAYSEVTSSDTLPNRVSEATGAAKSVERGQILERDGTIGPAGSAAGPSVQQGGRPVQEPKLKVGEAAQAPSGRSETRQVRGGQIHYAIGAAFAPKAEAFLKDFRKILDGYGLTGVSVKGWEMIFADLEHGAFGVEGQYLHSLIDVALTSKDPTMTLHHEAVHALFDLALSPSEKAILLRKSHKEWITDDIKKRYGAMSRAVQAEEGVAHAYTRWLAGERMDGMIARSFKRIKTYLKALLQALTKYDIRTADDVFRQMASGEIGRRTQVAQSASGARFDIAPPVLSTAFKKWFGKSKAVDAKGKPLVLYHGTIGNIDVFDPVPSRFSHDVGSHFGSATQASNILESRRERSREGKPITNEGENVYPVYVSVENPLRITDTDWTGQPLLFAHSLYKEGQITEAEMMSLMPEGYTLRQVVSADMDGGEATRSAQRDKVVALLKSKGYDGLVYENKYEGEGDSWVVFDPGQVKSATANVGTYDRNNPDIRFTFGGSRAETLDRAGLMRAQDMKDAGASRDEIYDETGFFVGHDGRWRFEINDEDATLDMSGAQQRPNSTARAKLGTLGSILKHPKLFAAYPSLADIPTTVVVQTGTGYSGDYQPDPKTESIEVVGRTEEEARSILLHEVMHALQTREDFAQGGNPSMGEDYEGLDLEAHDARVNELRAQWEEKFNTTGEMDNALSKQVNTLIDKLNRKARHQYYRRIAGEVEARNVQARDAMRQKAKETGDKSYQPDAPWWTQDTNADKVIFVHSKNDTAFKATETVDMFEGKREQFVIPGAEKVSQATLAQRRADAPLRPTKGQKGVEALPLFGDQKDQLPLFSKPPSGPNDPRFALTAAPHSAQQSQQVMQGFLNRGQAIDRAIRLPFALLGGIDAKGMWRPGKRLTEKMGPAGIQGFGIGGVLGAGVGTFVGGPVGTVAGFFAGGTVGAKILGSSPHPGGGRFGWFHGLAEHAKRGLIDGYGLDPEYIDTYRKSELGKAAILREAQGIMKVLSNAGVKTQEAKVLHAILNGDPVNDADMQRLAVPIRKAIDDMGAEAVSLGLISAESFQRNRGAYLHRVYLKNEVDQNTLAGWVSAKMSNRRKKIIGDELKGRGIFMDIEGDRLMQDVASFQAGKRGAAVLGEKFHVIDEVSTTPSLTPGGTAKEKTLRRVYLPANEAVPAKYQGAAWVDRGTWEVRKAGKKPTLWRDYTKAERGKMGELVDARYTIAKTFMLMANDLSTGRFFKDVAQKAEWTQSTTPAAKWKDASEYSQHWNDPEIQWVKVPDTSIDQTGGKKRWGALAGKFVRAEIWRDLNEVDIANKPGTWRALLTQWKKNHTGRHPVVHMNNVMSNVAFMDLADVRMQDLHAGIKAFFKGDANYQEALDNGAFGSDMVSQEIRDEVLKPILEEITKQQTGAKNPFLAKAGIAGVIADKIWTWAKTADNGMLRAYQAEDQLFRMATYMRRRSQGESPKVAAQNARDQFLNYDIRAPWIRAMRNSLFPFISYTYRAVPKLAENIAHRPWKLAKYAAIAYAVNALSYLWDDDDKDGETRERAALQDEEQGYTWLGSPRMIRMPWRDANGLPVFLDVRRWIPAGDVFDTTQGSSALPIPAPLHFGGPLTQAFEFALNKQSFTGEDITNDLTQDNGDKFTSVADWAWKSWTPPAFWNPDSYYWTKISNAVHGATDTAGHPYTIPQAVLSSLGIKVKPVDVENGITWHFYDFKKTQDALKKELRSSAYQLERGLISQKAFDSKSADIMEKFGNLEQRLNEFEKQIEPKKKAQ